MQNPFPLIHLSSLEFDFTSIEDLPSSSLFLAQFSQNYKPAFYRPIIRELRKRREAGRATIGNQAEMGINGTRESRQKDYFPRMEFMAWDFDISAGVSSLTSAQLLVSLGAFQTEENDGGKQNGN